MPRYAAIDIGSNSVRMEAAEVNPGSAPQILASERQVTRLGESVFRTGRISQEASDLVAGVLAQMSAAYKKLDVIGVRAVATAAVRDASNQQEFLARMSGVLGTPVEVISGQEEARLIHLGVQTIWPHRNKRILVIDIGGGSVEIIDGEAGHMRQAYSKPLGAVRLTTVFLKTDPPTERELHRMDDYIEERIASAVQKLGNQRWDRAIATSATASALICAVNRIPRARREGADRLRASTRQMRQLYTRLAASSLNERRKITGIGPRRAEIIVPGAAVLLRVLEDFRLPSVYYSAAGVRDGIIADLAARRVGKELSELSPDQRRAVEEMARHYGVPIKHARKVATVSHVLFSGLHSLHKLPPDAGKLLEAAAYLHDVGHYVSDTRHHKHSYYLVANSDMPGFRERERELIANLCRYHRKSPPVAPHTNYQTLTAEEKRSVLLLFPLLRIADALDRSHDQRVEEVACTVRNGQVLLQLGSNQDIDLEQWAAERAGETFRQIYDRPMSVARMKRA